MMFVWHYALFLLLAVPALVAAYLWLLRRANKPALRYAGFALVREAVGSAQQFRPHLPPLLLLAGLAALLIAIARPVMVITTPSQQGTVVLLMDVSLSMAASDVPPTRLAAARAAALDFVKAQPRDVRIGVVAFGGHADVVQLPTLNRADVLAALDRLELQRFTAIGSGLIGALLTLHPTADIEQGYDIFGIGRAPARVRDVPVNAQERARKPIPDADLSTAIVLISDGLGTMGISPLVAAKTAAELGIRVFTIGVGTLYGGVANVEGWPPIHAEFSEETLEKIADITGGEYFLARTADKVARIYEKLGRRLVLERQELEITVLFTALGIILSLASAGLSLSWAGRPA